MQDSLLQYFGESEISFDQFVIQTPSGQVLKDKQLVKLEPQVFTFLLLLIRHKDHIVSREEIVAEVWAGKKASDDAIRALVKKLRIALGDNARAPKFLKTVPLKGYLFIMPVHIEFNQADWWRSKYAMYGACVVAAILITLLVQSQFGSFQSNQSVPKREVSISTITEMNGSEVSPHLSKNDRLLYSHRGVNDKSLHLYVKNLNSAISKRLTWDTANYTDGIFSRDASQAIAKKREGAQESFVLFNFDANVSLINAEPVILDEALTLQRISALSYSHNDESLYLFGESKGDGTYNSELNSNEPNSSEPTTTTNTLQTNYGLIRYTIASKESVVVALPVPLGSRVIDAKESDDGKLLAALIQSENHADIHIVELDSKEVVLVKRIPSFATGFVWSSDGDAISFVANNGELLNLNLARQRLYAWTGLPMKISEVVSQCGEYCFVVKEKEADLVNIIEQPFVFNRQAYISTSQFRLSSNDRFPTYFNGGNGIYFLSLSENALALQRYVEGQAIDTIYELPKTSDIESFVLSPNEKRFAGELDGRIFVYDLEMSTLSFLTSGAEKHRNPVWANNDRVLYQQNDNNLSTIYSQDVSSGKFSLVAKGISLLKPLTAEQWLVVDDQLQAYIYSKEEIVSLNAGISEAKTKFADVSSAASANFKMLNNQLYFMSNNDSLPLLNQLDLQTLTLASEELGVLSALPQFDIHPSTQKMLVVESSLSRSNLLKVDGLTLATRQVNQVVTEIP